MDSHSITLCTLVTSHVSYIILSHVQHPFYTVRPTSTTVLSSVRWEGGGGVAAEEYFNVAGSGAGLLGAAALDLGGLDGSGASVHIALSPVHKARASGCKEMSLINKYEPQFHMYKHISPTSSDCQ